MNCVHVCIYYTLYIDVDELCMYILYTTVYIDVYELCSVYVYIIHYIMT